MQIDVLSLFPEMFSGFLASSIVARAIEKEAIDVILTDFRSYSTNKHRKVDDYAYGGFAGLVLQAQPIWDALKALTAQGPAPVIYFTPQGRKLTQSILEHYAALPRVILLCGHYKELDQRIRDMAVSDEVSLGDYVLSGGELASMVFIDGVARLQAGVLTDAQSASSDSFSDGKDSLGFPCYTRPEEWMGVKVPQVLTSGDHAQIEAWAQAQAQSLTRTRKTNEAASKLKGPMRLSKS
ncbi:MAG TPA: tRNA (guanosine(37)-N1)-methyltransferase TrmD [Candidatus Cloacimonetes bacterium]|nr:tRNA (guanosine(37)-N1)-methyltransferase TrmD [Candidatus Cloacimonadota bacterium]